MTEISAVAATTTSPKTSLIKGVLRTPQGLVSVIVLAIIVLAVAFAGLIAPFDPAYIDTDALGGAPSATHWLGTDPLGRDILARLLHGGQTNLAGALLALVVALVFGVPTGLIAGYFGGWFDGIANWVTNLIIAIPAIIVLLAVSAIVGPSVWVSMSVFGIILAPSFFRLVRTSVMAVREELYVDAAKVSGLSNTAIIGRHILSVVRGPLIIQSAFVLGIAIAIQAGLEFLGLGDQTRPSWGGMLNQAFLNIYRSPQLLIWPVSIIVLTTIALAIIANTLRDVLQEGGPGVSWKRAEAIAGHAAATAAPVETVAATSALLSVDGLRVAYPNTSGINEVVHGVSFTLQRGEILGLVGESGSGKTQTAFSILGLLPDLGRITGGALHFDGMPLRGLDRKSYEKLRGARIGYIPQEPMSNLIPSFTIGTQLVDPIVFHLKVSRSEAKTRVIALLERVGITDPERVFRAYPHEISGGMAQRVLIAGAVSCDPDLLIADEPTTALDVTVQAEVLDLIRGLQRERNLGVLLVTHNFGVVADLCDRVAVMQHGEIVEQAPVEQLFSNPQHEYTRMLLGSVLDNREPKSVLQGSNDHD